MTGWDRKFGLQLISQCGSTYNCLSRSVPEIHSHVARTLSSQQSTTWKVHAKLQGYFLHVIVQLFIHIIHLHHLFLARTQAPFSKSSYGDDKCIHSPVYFTYLSTVYILFICFFDNLFIYLCIYLFSCSFLFLSKLHHLRLLLPIQTDVSARGGHFLRILRSASHQLLRLFGLAHNARARFFPQPENVGEHRNLRQ